MSKRKASIKTMIVFLKCGPGQEIRFVSQVNSLEKSEQFDNKESSDLESRKPAEKRRIAEIKRRAVASI